MVHRVVVIVLMVCLLAPLDVLQHAAGVLAQADSITVEGSVPWTDTGIDLANSERVTLVATGEIVVEPSATGISPNGDPTCAAGAGNAVPGLPCSSLVGQIGDETPFAIGEGVEFRVREPGRLYLGVNDDLRGFADNTGTWTVSVTVESPLAQQTSDPFQPAMPMYRGNAARTGVMPGPGPAGQPRERWKFDAGDVIDSSPAVANGMVYVGSNDGNLYAVDAESGAERWHFATEGDVISSPAVADGIVYVGSNDDNVYALNAATGQGLWRTPTGSNVESSPVIEKGVVYILANAGELLALEVDTGDILWGFATQDNNELSSPVIADGVVYIGSATGRLYAVDAVTGEERWRFAPGTGPIFTTPTIANGVVYFIGDGGPLYALDAQSGAELWHNDAADLGRSSPAIFDGIVYGTGDGTIFAFDATSGQLLWEAPAGVTTPISIVEGALYFGTNDGLVAVDGSDGSGLWSIDLRSHDENSSSPAVVGGVVYIGGLSTLYAIEGSAGEVAGPPPPQAPIFRGDPARTGTMPGPGPAGQPSMLWSLPIAVETSVAAFDDTVYATSQDGSVQALDLHTGEQRWAAAVEPEYDGGGVSPPTVADGLLYVTGAEDIYAFDALTGDFRWQSGFGNLSSPVVVNRKLYASLSQSTPFGLLVCDAAIGNCQDMAEIGGDYVTLGEVTVEDGVIYVGDAEGYVFALDAASGDVLWAFTAVAAIQSSIAVAEGTVFFGSEDHNVYAVDAATGTELWRFGTGDVVASSPAVADGVVYVGSDDGNVYALDAASGQLLWSFGTGGPVRSSPGIVSNIVFVGSDDGNVYAIDGFSGRQRWQFSTDGPVASSPVVIDGIVLVGSADNTLYALTGLPLVYGTPVASAEQGQSEGTPSVSHLESSDQGVQVPSVAIGDLVDILPVEDDVPSGLIRTEDRTRTLDEVAQVYIDPADVMQRFASWGWQENAVRTFGVPAGSTSPVDSATYVSISIHRFESSSGASQALDYAVGDEAAEFGLQEIATDSMGDRSRTIAGATEQGNDTVVFTQQDTMLIVVDVMSPQGDTTPTALAVTQKILA